MWPLRRGISGRVRASPGGPEGVGDFGAGPQPRPPGLRSGRDGIDGAGGEQYVPAGRGLRAVVRVGMGAQRLRLPHRPLQRHALGVGVGNGVGLAVAHQDHLVEDLALRVGERPAAHPPVVGGQVAGRDRQALAGNDEDQQAALGQVAGRVGEEGVLRALVLGVVVIRRVQEEQPEGPVRYRRGEQVRGQGVVEPFLGLLRPVPVQLDAVGLDGDGVGPVQALGQLRQRLSRPAAGVEDAQRLPAPVVGAGGGVNQLRDQVDDPGRRGVEPTFCLSSESHVTSPFVSGVVRRVRRRWRCSLGGSALRPPLRRPRCAGSRGLGESRCSRRRLCRRR